MRKLARFPCLLASLLLVAAPTGAAEPDGLHLFREKVEPVLKAKCYRCHSTTSEKVKGGLLLDTREGLLKGGDTGPAVVPGKSGESLLLQAVRHEEGLEMPPKAPKLPAATAADIAAWIDAGAPGPVESPTAAADDPRRHWAFQPVKKAAPPKVQDTGWAKTPVDAFILAALEAKHWKPAPPVDRSVWLRRVTFDLTGLPPTPDEIEAYVKDTSRSAEEQVVDRLLSSPRYGERWGQHWLDLVRFAETEGYEYDRHVPDAWRFRDYVIDAFNRDKPFDRFLTEQIAGDEISPDDPECQTASTFHRLGPIRRNAGNADIAFSRNDELIERTDILGTTFLGLSIGCARCHNHKLEPITQKDYYRLQAFLAATDEHNINLASKDQQDAWEATAKRLKRELQKVKAQAAKAVGDEKTRLTSEAAAIEDRMESPLPVIPATHNNFKQRTPIHVLKRGAWENKGEPVGPRPPSVLVSDAFPELPADVPNPRTQLARWLADPAQPLTPRVLVNRLWQHHFGAGLVKTANDFGTKGDRPSHPELLDWLAASLVENGWRLKPLHRLIVLSSTYRQSGQSPTAEAKLVDPENRLLWHFSRRRLTAEEIRDSMLAASGRLNLLPGGPSVMVPVDPGMLKQLYKSSQWRVSPDAADHDRRSVYLIAKRNLRLPFMEAFDAPAMQTSCARRESSTHAPQALELLNGGLSNDLAEAFARRLDRESQGDHARAVDRAFQVALGRPPTPEERSLSLDFLAEQPLKEFALAVFNLNGFLYVP